MQIVTLDQVHTLHGSQIHNLNGIKYPQEIYVANWRALFRCQIFTTFDHYF